MADATLTLTLVHEVFHGPEGPARLALRLAQAKASGAELAVLAELPLDPWVPASKEARDADAEEPDGPRSQRLSTAAREAGIAVLGGAITREPGSRRRVNRALLFDANGRLRLAYDKLHVPHEAGFWERSHYEPGERIPETAELRGFPVGIQICSDLNRPEGSHLLGARGALAILAPRATPRETLERWRLVIRANAVTSCTYVVSVNRPGDEPGIPIGGTSIVASPTGDVLVETTDPLTTVTLEASVVEHARREYPGYLAVRSALYAAGWKRVAEE